MSMSIVNEQLDRHLSLDGGAASYGEDGIDNENDVSWIDSTESIAAESTDEDAPINHDRTNALQTYLHILKGNVGPGCLSLPWAVSILGIRLSLITLVSLCVITSFNCWSVVRWKRRHASDRRDVTYADLGEIAHGPRFRAFVLGCVCLTQLCVCTVFFSFIGGNVAAVMRAGGVPLLDDHRVIMTLVLPLVMLLSCAPNLRVLAPVTAVGMAMLFLGFGCIGLIIGGNWSRRPSDLPTTSDWSQVPLAMCAFLYSFEGINLVIPIEAAMIHPRRFDAVFASAMATVTAIYAAFACLCVVAFGDVDDGSVTAFLMNNAEEYAAKNLVLAANFIVSLSVLASYPLQLMPAIVLLGQMRERMARPGGARPVSGADGDDDNNNNSEVEGAASATFAPLDREMDGRPNDELGAESSDVEKGGLFRNRTTFEGDSPLLRAGLVIGTYLLAVFVPNVQELISLSGAFAGSSAAMIIPPLLELRSILEDNHRFSSTAVSRYILLLIGAIFLVVGTSASIVDIVKAFNDE